MEVSYFSGVMHGGIVSRLVEVAQMVESVMLRPKLIMPNDADNQAGAADTSVTKGQVAGPSLSANCLSDRGRFDTRPNPVSKGQL